MGVEDPEAFEQQGERPGERGDPAGNRRGEDDLAKNVLAIGEEQPDFNWLDAARLRIGRVEAEIVPLPWHLTRLQQIMLQH